MSRPAARTAAGLDEGKPIPTCCAGTTAERSGAVAAAVIFCPPIVEACLQFLCTTQSVPDFFRVPQSCLASPIENGPVRTR